MGDNAIIKVRDWARKETALNLSLKQEGRLSAIRRRGVAPQPCRYTLLRTGDPINPVRGRLGAVSAVTPTRPSHALSSR
jgi:hypothetical protein